MAKLEYTPREEKILIRSGDQSGAGRMKQSAIVTGTAFAFLLIGVTLGSKNPWFVLIAALAYIAVTVLEKTAWANALASYRALIVKLSKHINEIEKKG